MLLPRLSFIGLVCTLAVCAVAHAQSAGYHSEEFQAAWVPVSGSAQQFQYTNPQNGYGLVALPFNFTYNDSLLGAGSSITVCANGVISLTGMSAPDSSVLGDPRFRAALCIFSGNMTTGDGTNFFDSTEVTGVAPNRVLTIQYHGIHFPKSGAGKGNGAITQMQVKLYETTNAIEFIYKDHGLSFSDTSSIRCDIGLNGGLLGPFDFIAYATDTKLTPASDIRWLPSTSGVTPADREPKLVFYPSPARDRISIDRSGIRHIEIEDALGRSQHAAWRETSGATNVDVSRLPSGTYFIHLDDEVLRMNIAR
jgi:hypothetical protein